MERSKIKRANDLIDAIDDLEDVVCELRPEFCTGIGINPETKTNDPTNYYKVHLARGYHNGKNGRSSIMTVGVIAMYEEARRQLELAKDELEQLS